MRIPSVGAVFGLAGLPAEVRRGLFVAFSTSIAIVMGVNLVYPVLPTLLDEFGLDESAAGLVITVYTAPMILLLPFAGAAADLYGRRPMVLLGLGLFGLAGVASGLSPSFEWLLAFRAVQGVAASLISPLTIVLLSDLLAHSDERETSAQGAKVFLDRVGLAVVPALAGALVAISWRAPFLLYAAAVPVGLLGLRWLPDYERPKDATLRSWAGGFRGIGGRPRLFVAFAAGFLRFFLDYGYYTYLPIYLAATRGTSAATIGLLLACVAIGAMITSSQAGRIARGRDPAPLVFVGFAVSGVAILLVPVVPNDLLQGVVMVTYGLGGGLVSPLQKNLLTRNAPAGIRTGVVSLDRVFQQVAKTLAPGLMGLVLLATDITAVFWILGGLSLASVALAAALLNLRKPAESTAPA